MTANIGTKLHFAREASPNHVVLLQMQLYPHYVFDAELIGMFNSKDAQNSVRLMMDHDLAFLPFPEMTVELWGGNDWRYFWIIMNGKAPKSFEIMGIEYVNGAVIQDDIQMAVEYVNDAPELMNLETKEIYKADDPAVAEQAAWNIKWSDTFKSRQFPHGREDMIMHGLAALNLSLLIGHMADLDREVIEPKAIEKLNRSRQRSGKPSVHSHTIVRIGHYYDRDGKRHKYGGTGSRDGRMKMHMRAAHKRWQHHGPQWIEDHPEEAQKPWNAKDGHVVIIPAVMVNFNDGSPLEKPLPKVVKK